MAAGIVISTVNDVSENEWAELAFADFVPSKGDYLNVNLEESIGYLFNDESKEFMTFPVLSGQRRNICYIGRCYYGATPEQDWVVKEMNIQSDRITFSASGKFLRLYEGGETRTSYGIHGHAYFNSMIQRDDKYQSMGCILVADDIMDLLEESFYANDNELRVLTFS